MSAKFYVLSKVGLQKDWHLHLPKTSKITRETLWNYATAGVAPAKAVGLMRQGTKRVDFLYSAGLFFAASERAFEVFKQNKLTGYGSFPIAIVPATRQYHGLSILGKAGRVLGDGITEPDHFSKRLWDGSDFFVLKNSWLKIVTERVFQCVNNAELTGAHFDEIEAIR